MIAAKPLGQDAACRNTLGAPAQTWPFYPNCRRYHPGTEAGYVGEDVENIHPEVAAEIVITMSRKAQMVSFYIDKSNQDLAQVG